MPGIVQTVAGPLGVLGEGEVVIFLKYEVLHGYAAIIGYINNDSQEISLPMQLIWLTHFRGHTSETKKARLGSFRN
jgi:hypothetical protein